MSPDSISRSSWVDDELAMVADQVAKFLEREFVPIADQWDREGRVGRDAWLKAGDAGILCAGIPTEYGGGGGTRGCMPSRAPWTWRIFARPAAGGATRRTSRRSRARAFASSGVTSRPDGATWPMRTASRRESGRRPRLGRRPRRAYSAASRSRSSTPM